MAAKLVIGNWKMHGKLADNQHLIDAMIGDPRINRSGIALASPSVYLLQLAKLLHESRIELASQDVSRFNGDGAYTGEISAAMLVDVGCRYTLIGHSERRCHFKEDEITLQQKVAHSLEAGLRPVLCVGESLQQREAGKHLETVRSQLEILKDFTKADVIVAYEPVWAIGSGRVAAAEQIHEMHGFIRSVGAQHGRSAMPVLYGGSVKPGNAADILSIDGVDGLLVGGASLDAASFGVICGAALNA